MLKLLNYSCSRCSFPSDYSDHFLVNINTVGSSPVVRTDGGGPYRAASRKGIRSRRGVTRPMSRPGRCGDSAWAEGFFGTLEVEFLYGRDWARASPGGFRAALADYVEWCRDGRLKLFVEPDGTRRYETIMGRRRRLGLAG